MAKLYFRHGCMGSSKTLNMLAVSHNYKTQNKCAVLMKPKLDDRFGNDVVKSRAGLSMTADLMIDDTTNIVDYIEGKNIDCILVDESQFLSPSHVEQLRLITIKFNIPVICYGLRTDFKSKLFEGSKRLLELADSIEEVKTTCHYCNKKAIMNIKHNGENILTDGPTIELGAEDLYYSSCFKCYNEKTNMMK